MKLKDLIKQSDIIMGKVYTAKDNPPFKVPNVTEASDKIQVQGVGVYPYDVLKKKVQKMSIDLLKNAKKGEWKKSSRNGIRAFAEMWDALAKYEEKK
jgi:cytochrome c556